MGFDTETSMDHNWGPRLQLFVDDPSLITELDRFFGFELPFQYNSFSVNYTKPGYDGTIRMEYTDKKPVNHLIEINRFEDYLKQRYSFDRISDFTPRDWLQFTDQRLIEITSGEVYHDGLYKLEKTRTELKFYPQDICKLWLAVLWDYISNKEAFIGRNIATDDYIGLKINASRIVNYLIKILFYLEKKYIPYSKWFGSAFKTLTSYNDTNSTVIKVLTENEPKKIEEHLCALYELVIEKHNKAASSKTAGLPHLDNKIRNYFNRPYKVLFSENISGELKNSIEDEELRKTDIQDYGSDIIKDR
jgi:hypothetical protein